MERMFQASYCISVLSMHMQQANAGHSMIWSHHIHQCDATAHLWTHYSDGSLYANFRHVNIRKSQRKLPSAFDNWTVLELETSFQARLDTYVRSPSDYDANPKGRAKRWKYGSTYIIVNVETGR
jgi:hypothetical protein